jgi:uncharacterized protein with HEPN domain
MPRPDDTSRLHHILDSSRKAVDFIEGKSRRELDRNELLALGLVRLLEIIGEASAGVTPDFCARHPEIPWRQMSDTRNRLIHGYFEVDYDIIWETVTKELPPLIVKFEKALAAEGI